MAVISTGTLPLRQPLYLQVRERVAQAIAAREWDAGVVLPSEIELAERFGVSQGTVRKGLDALVSEGVLVRKQGLGTFVAEVEEDWGRVTLPGDARVLGSTVELLACARSHAGEELAQALRLRRGVEVVSIKRLVRVAGEPFAVIDSFVGAERFAGLDARQIQQVGSNLRTLWWREYGLRVRAQLPQFRAGRASREDARLLQLAPDAPLLEVARLACSKDAQAVEWTVLHCRTDQYAYSL